MKSIIMEKSALYEYLTEGHILWRRFCARVIDLAVYQFLVSACLRLVLHVNTSIEVGWRIVEIPLPIILMYVIEPILLSVIGTTLGKRIFGIYVLNESGNIISYKNAKRRSFRVFWYGMGVYFTPVMLWRLGKSYIDGKAGRRLPWEEDSKVYILDKKKWRYIVFVVSMSAILFLNAWSLVQAIVPKHRGALTVEKFCENYNQISKYLFLTPDMELDAQGNWIDTDGIIITSADGKVMTYPEFTFVEKNGTITEVGFVCEPSDESFVWADSIKEQMIGAALSYIGAQKEFSFLASDLKELVRYIENHISDDFELTEAGILMTYQIEYEGYENVSEMMIPMEGKESYCIFKFNMKTLNLK